MALENAKRDQNYVTTLMGVDMSTGLVPTKVYVDETTHRLLVSAVVTSSVDGANFLTKVDKSSTTSVIYVGQAAIGSATSSAVWLITKIDKTVTDNITITYGAAGAFTSIWDNRTTSVVYT